MSVRESREATCVMVYAYADTSSDFAGDAEVDLQYQDHSGKNLFEAEVYL